MLISIVGVALICVVGFRSIRHPAYVVLTILISAAWTFGFTTLTVGHLNILSSAFLVTLIGLGIDYGVLWVSKYEAVRQAGFNDDLASDETYRTVGAGLFTGALTTAAAFFTTVTTGFVGLVEMGWIAGWGIALSLLATLTFLPALLAASRSLPIRMPKGKSRGEIELTFNRPALGSISLRPVGVIAASLAAIAAVSAYAPRVRLDCNLLNLQQQSLPSVVWERTLIERTGTSGWFAVSTADSADEARERRKKFEKLPSVGRVVDMASLIPVDQESKRSIIASIRTIVADVPKVDSLVDSLPVDAVKLTELCEAIKKIDEPKEAGDKIIHRRSVAAVEGLLESLSRLPAGERKDRLSDFQNRMRRDLAFQLNRLRDAASLEPVGVADLPPSLRDRYVSGGGKWLIQIFAKQSVWDLEPLDEFCADLRTVDPHVTGKPVATHYAMTQMVAGYRNASILSAAIIFITLLIGFQSLKDSLLAMIPLAAGFIVMFGLMGLFDVDLNPADLISLPLLLGIGIDYGVHVVHDYRRSARPYVLGRRHSRALLMTGLTTLVSFASLWTSDHWGMRSIGLTLAIGIGSCLFAAQLLLPAILNLVSRDAAELRSILFESPERRTSDLDDRFAEVTSISKAA
jgi:hypothetical protein